MKIEFGLYLGPFSVASFNSQEWTDLAFVLLLDNFLRHLAGQMAEKLEFPTPNYSHIKKKCFENVYDPAEDSFLMMDALEIKMEDIKKLRPTVCLEIGTGSGVLTAFLASNLGNGTFYFATDINGNAALCATETAKLNNSDINCIIDDLFTSLMPRLKNNIDVILFNPPYVVTPSDEIGGQSIEAAWAGGIDGREVIDRFLPHVSSLLSDNGVLFMVLIDKNKPDEVINIIADQGLSGEIVLKRRAGIEHLFIVQFSKIIK